MKAMSIGLKATDIVVHAHPCWYLGATVVGENGATLTIWDSPDSTTDNDVEIDYFKCTTQKYNICHILKEPVWCSKGIFPIKTGTVSVIVWYAL